MAYPTRLARSPLTEAVFEMRFVPIADQGVEHLFGRLYASIGSEFPTVETMPLAALPKEMRNRPELKYAPHYKLTGGPQAVTFGDFAVTFNVTPPYPGWPRLRDQCVKIATALRNAGHVQNLERYSLKYVNVIEPEGKPPTLDDLNIRFDPAGYSPGPVGLRLRFETLSRPFINIVEVVQADTITTTYDNKTRPGWLLSVDTICEMDSTEDFWSNVGGRIDAAHDVLKPIFYDLLASRTLESLGPSYD